MSSFSNLGGFKDKVHTETVQYASSDIPSHTAKIDSIAPEKETTQKPKKGKAKELSDQTKAKPFEPSDVVPENLPPYPMMDEIVYLTTAQATDKALAHIKDGIVGFDAEFDKRMPTKEEEIVDRLFEEVGGNKKSMILAWQIIELRTSNRNISLCSIQIARDNCVWVINLNNMTAYPDQLKRILCSTDVLKVGVGLNTDVPRVWIDLRTDLMNMIDVGCMAKLLLAHKYAEQSYSNLSLQNSVAEILGYYVEKELQTSDWKGKDHNGELTADQQKYAAIDASASLRLYYALVPALEDKKRILGVSIPPNWYSMNSRYGELMRMHKTVWGETLPWSVKDCYWYNAGKFQGYT